MTRFEGPSGPMGPAGLPPLRDLLTELMAIPGLAGHEERVAQAVAALARWVGPVAEDECPYGPFPGSPAEISRTTASTFS